MSSESKIGLAVGMTLVFFLLAVFLVYQFDQGSEAVHTLAHEVKNIVLTVVIGLLIIGQVFALGWAAREVIRAWRTAEATPPERITIKETKVIEREGRLPQAPQIVTLPNGQMAMGLFPEMIRSGWQQSVVGQAEAAGLLEGGPGWPQEPQTEDAEFEVFDPPADWH